MTMALCGKSGLPSCVADTSGGTICRVTSPDGGGHPYPLSPDARRLVTRAAADFSASVEQIQRRIDDVLVAGIPELGRAPDLRETLARSTRAQLTLLGAQLAIWADPRTATPPQEAVDLATEFVRHGLPVESLLRAYRLGHAEVARYWQQLLAARAPDPQTLTEASPVTFAWMFADLDTMLQPIIDDYIAERERRARQSQSVRDNELRRVLSGDAVNIERAGTLLRYRLDRWHVGFIAWVPDGSDDETAAKRLDAAAAELTRAIGIDEAPLVSQASRFAVHGWAGSWTRPDTPPPAAIDGVHVAIGEPGQGVPGFRRTHEQAQLARRIARLRRDGTPPTTRYRDCEVASLLSADLDQARRFAHAVLGPLAQDTESAQRLVETLDALYDEALSLNRAAKRLHVHSNTVAYRIRRALELTGETDVGSPRLRAAIALAPLIEPSYGTTPLDT
jgi:PucR C-terminal helix-turn-helix domain